MTGRMAGITAIDVLGSSRVIMMAAGGGVVGIYSHVKDPARAAPCPSSYGYRIVAQADQGHQSY